MLPRQPSARALPCQPGLLAGPLQLLRASASLCEVPLNPTRRALLYSTTAYVVCHLQETAPGSSAPLSVTLWLVPSAGTGGAPVQATGSSLGRCLGTAHATWQTLEMFRTAPLVCVFFSSLLPLRKTHRTFQRRSGRGWLTLMCFVAPNDVFLKKHCLPYRRCFGSRVFLCSLPPHWQWHRNYSNTPY